MNNNLKEQISKIDNQFFKLKMDMCTKNGGNLQLIPEKQQDIITCVMALSNPKFTVISSGSMNDSNNIQLSNLTKLSEKFDYVAPHLKQKCMEIMSSSDFRLKMMRCYGNGSSLCKIKQEDQDIISCLVALKNERFMIFKKYGYIYYTMDQLHGKLGYVADHLRNECMELLDSK